MISGKVAAISGTILLTTTISWAQQNFPLRPGEWESTTSFSDRRSLLKQRLCLNDRKWTEVIVQADVGSPPACNGDALATEKGLNGGGTATIYTRPHTRSSERIFRSKMSTMTRSPLRLASTG